MSNPTSPADFAPLLSTLTAHLSQRDASLSTLPTLPTSSSVQHTLTSLPSSLPSSGLGTPDTLDWLINTILPGCLQAQNGPRYFGFVTGGVTPAAQLADMLVTAYDENVQVALPETAATAIEARTLELVLDLIGVDRGVFEGRTITTGATASNVLGMACARDHLYCAHGTDSYSYSRDGPPPSIIPPIILALHPHFSILKAAALVGLGNGPRVVHSMPPGENELAFDLIQLEARLRSESNAGRGIIVAYGLGEVNTGGFGGDLTEVGRLCNEYGAWLHVDAAFGGFAGAVPEFRHLIDGIELASSLTLDGHKWLNVPYDTGLFYTRKSSSLPGIFAPAETPAYLSSGEGVSPLYVNIENSRRFRALPLLASLMSLGAEGYADIVRRNVSFARSVAQFIHENPHYDLLNHTDDVIPLNIVLFAPSASSSLASSDNPSARLAERINGTREMYVTGTKWRDIGAVRLAVSNWRTGLESDDLAIVKDVLTRVMH